MEYFQLTIVGKKINFVSQLLRKASTLINTQNDDKIIK